MGAAAAAAVPSPVVFTGGGPEAAWPGAAEDGAGADVGWLDAAVAVAATGGGAEAG
jgi:hypothetical protein